MQNKIKEYQNNFGFSLKSYQGHGMLAEWELNLMRDIGAITYQNHGKPFGMVIRIVATKYIEYQKQKKEVFSNWRKQAYAIKMNTQPLPNSNPVA